MRPPSKTIWNYAVTFEYTLLAPETIRGEVAAGSPHLAASRAIRAAKKAKGRSRPDSLVILIQKS